MSDIKGFYRQRKKSGISKPRSSAKSKRKEAASCGSDSAQPPALVSHASLDLQDDWDEQEDVLRRFDMNMAYGPCLGMSRLARWERAVALGLSPPKEVHELLSSGKANADCLWEGRV